MCTADANRYVSRFKGSLVCCLWSVDRPSLPGGPFPHGPRLARARTQTRTQKTHASRSMGPELIRRGHQVKKSGNNSKEEKKSCCLKMYGTLRLQSDTDTHTHTHIPRLKQSQDQHQFVRLKTANLPQNTNITASTCSQIHKLTLSNRAHTPERPSLSLSIYI